VSGIDREKGLVVIRPGRGPCDNMKPGDLVVLDLDGNITEEKYKPMSDIPTHLVLYKRFELTRKQQLIVSNDKEFIPPMEAIGVKKENIE